MSETRQHEPIDTPIVVNSAATLESVENIIDPSLANMQTSEWSRVSPLAILYFFSKTIYELVSSVLIFSLPAFAASYSTIKEHPVYFVFGLLMFFSLILLNSVAKYWFYYYKFTNDRVEIKQGVFKKSHLDLPFGKIQNVKIVQPIYYRFNKYSFIELDTAGSARQEAKIVALPLALAESFKQMILQIKRYEPLSSQDDSPASTKTQADQETLLNERSLMDLVIHGISNNRVWIFLGFLAPFYNTIGENIGAVLEGVGIDIIAYLDYQSQSIGLFVLHVLSLVMLIMLVIVTFSVVGSIFVFYNYKLSRLGDRYIRRSGLLTKHEISMRLSRIQIAVQQQDWLDLIIGRINLRFEQNTSLPAGGRQAGSINNASKLIVPSVTPTQSAMLIQDAFDVKAFSSIVFQRISKRFIFRVLAFPILPILFMINTLVLKTSELDVPVWSFLLALNIILISLVYLRWWRWGYYFEDGFVYIRKGLLGVNYYVFPIGKTQQVTYKQSVFMRPRKLADISYVLASGAHKVPLIPQSLAREQANQALLIVARDKPSWM
ncbi:MAG: putative membrane protein [Patiriisocius sp.]|jgi:putative membrane protein